MNILFVAGTWDKEGGKPSGLIKKMYDSDEEENGQKLADDILNRLTKIKPHEWGDR